MFLEQIYGWEQKIEFVGSRGSRRRLYVNSSDDVKAMDFLESIPYCFVHKRLAMYMFTTH